MRLACCFLSFAAVSFAGHTLTVNNVFLNGTGPFRMLVDTGNATSIVRPEVARRLNLKPAYAVEHATLAQVKRAAVAVLDEVRTGSTTDRCVEAIIADVFQPRVDGVLGANWLVRHDYLLDYRNRRIVLDGAPVNSGFRALLHSTDGRPVVSASVDGYARELVVDSGASAVVLYEKSAAHGTLVQLAANGGVVAARSSRARLALAGGVERSVDAVRIDARGLGPGLLPASAFGSVFVSNREGFVEFGR